MESGYVQLIPTTFYEKCSLQYLIFLDKSLI